MSINARNIVCNMAPDGLATEAGLQMGDLLISFGGAEVSGEEALFAAMLKLPDGEKVEFVVSRAVVEAPVPDNVV